MVADTLKQQEGSRQASGGLLRALALLWLAGVMLRATILALPPVLQSVVADLQLHGFDIGVLTAIPPLLFALAAVPAALLIGRFGAVHSLLAGLLINAGGAAARGFTSGVIGLEAATCVMCLGVAIMQPALPTLVREWTPARVGLASATYTCGLLCGEVLPIISPGVPDLPLVGGGWRAMLFLWSLPVLATAAVIGVLQPRIQRAENTRENPILPSWRTGSIWKIGLLLGAVNAAYFSLNGFLPVWLARAGNSSTIKPALLALNAAQIPASLLLMIFVERVALVRGGYVVAGLTVLAGSLGLVTAAPAFAVPLAAVTGFSLACLLTMALALPPLTAAAAEVPGLSAAVFTVSYTIAVLTALLTGVLETAGASQFTSVLPIAAAALVVVGVGTTMRRSTGAQRSAARPRAAAAERRDHAE